MKKERIIRASKPIVCTGIVRMPNKVTLNSIREVLV